MWRRPGQLGGHREKVMSSRVGLDQEKGMSKKRKREGGRLPHMRVSKSGRIQNKFGLRYYPTPNASGRCVVGLSSAGRVAHVFLNILVYVLFSNLDPKKVKPGHTIDHIDRVPTNNCFENLQIANKKEQRANQDRSGVTRGVPVVATNLETNEKVRYGSAREAARATGVSKTMVVECCQGKQEKSKGYSFAYAESQEPMEGEVFKPFGNKGHQVSNMGRIKLKSGTIFTPVSVDEDGYYFFAGERVHILVCTAFKGPRPSKEHTVDHLDGDKSNNTAVNLEWATKQEQSLNQGEHRPRATNQWRGRQVTTTVSTGEWIPFTTVKEAAKGTGCVAQHIHDCANPNQNRKKAKDGNGVEWEWKKVDGAPIGRTIHTTKEFTSWQVFETTQQAEEKTGCTAHEIAAVANLNSASKTAPSTDGSRWEFEEVRDSSQDDLPGEVWMEVDPEDWLPDGKYYGIFDQQEAAQWRGTKVVTTVSKGEWTDFESVPEAAAKTGCTKDGIYRAYDPNITDTKKTKSKTGESWEFEKNDDGLRGRRVYISVQEKETSTFDSIDEARKATGCSKKCIRGAADPNHTRKIAAGYNETRWAWEKIVPQTDANEAGTSASHAALAEADSEADSEAEEWD